MNATISQIQPLKPQRTKEFSSSSRADYKRSVNRLVYGLWSGQISISSFVDSMLLAINRSFHRAWLDGSMLCGITERDWTTEERAVLDDNINQETLYAVEFANDIVLGSKAVGGKLLPLQIRAEMWANSYDRIFNLAQQMACADNKLKWELGPTKEHCSTCTKMNGRVYRASVWAKYGIQPQSRDLECSGYRCRCRFVDTDEPVTPGRPPAIP